MVFSIGLYRIFSEYRCHRGYECLFNEIILDKEKRKEYYYRKSKETKGIFIFKAIEEIFC